FRRHRPPLRHQSRQPASAARGSAGGRGTAHRAVGRQGPAPRAVQGRQAGARSNDARGVGHPAKRRPVPPGRRHARSGDPLSGIREPAGARAGRRSKKGRGAPRASCHRAPVLRYLQPARTNQGERVMRVLTTIGAACLFGAVAVGQAPVPNPTNKTGVIGLMHAIHSTNDVEKTLAFYQAVFGLSGQVRPFPSNGPQILTDSPGATLRVAMTQLKGAFNFELTEFGNIERQLHKQPEIADPGAPMMKIIVRDLDAVVAAAKKVNAPIVTRGGAPIVAPTSVGRTRAIIMRDPDGFFVQAIQGTPAPDAPEGPVIGAILGLTARDMDETLKYWN